MCVNVGSRNSYLWCEKRQSCEWMRTNLSDRNVAWGAGIPEGTTNTWMLNTNWKDILTAYKVFFWIMQDPRPRGSTLYGKILEQSPTENLL